MEGTNEASEPKTRLVKATPEQIIQCWRENGKEWADGLTIDEHVAREQAQVDTWADLNDSNAHQMQDEPLEIHWTLQDDTNTILAACECLYRPAVTAAGLTIMTYCIASVYVPEHLRHRGHASDLMQRVMRTLEETKVIKASALFSDIGESWYTRFGWKNYPTLDVHLTNFRPTTPLVEGEYVTFETLNATMSWEEEIVQTEVMLDKSYCGWSFLPTAGVMRWHYARSRFVNEAKFGKSGLDKLGFAANDVGLIMWNIELAKRTMTILRLRHDCGTIPRLRKD